MTFAQKLKAVRTDRGLSQNELARLTDLSQAMIAQYELGIKCPHINTLKELARKLHVEIEDLQTDDEKE